MKIVEESLVSHGIDNDHENSTYENMRDALQGVDEPMEDSHPTASFAMVYGAYPMILLVLVVLTLAVLTVLPIL